MAKIIGVMASERIVAGMVEGNRVTGEIRVYPEPGSNSEGLQGAAIEKHLVVRFLQRHRVIWSDQVKFDAGKRSRIVAELLVSPPADVVNPFPSSLLFGTSS